MQIGIYHHRVGWERVGGTEVFLQQMATQLGADHEVTVYSVADDGVVPELQDAPVDVETVDHTRFKEWIGTVMPLTIPTVVDSLAFYFAARQAGMPTLIDEREEVVLTSFWVDDLLLSRTAEVPVVFEYHGNLRQVGMGTRLHDRLTDAAVRLSNSATTREVLESEAGVGIDGVVRPGIDQSFFAGGTPNRFDGEQPAVLCVGRQDREKGIGDLITAVTRMDRSPVLHLVGTGPHEEVFNRMAMALGVEEQVRQHGAVPREVLPDYYASADVVCHPSHFESWCMTNLEAMAAGTPVVTTALPAIKEYANDGQNCLLVEPQSPDGLATALDRVLGESALTNSLVEAGESTAAAYSWGEQAVALEQYLAAAKRR